MDQKRTRQQNNALHLLFNLLSDGLNDAGLDMVHTLKPGTEIPWTSQNVKEFLWRPIQEAQLGKKSTTELTTKEIDQVFDTLNRHLGNKFKLHVPFPSIEEVMYQQDIKKESKNGKN